MKLRMLILSIIVFLIFGVTLTYSQTDADSIATPKIRVDTTIAPTSSKAEQAVGKITESIQETRPAFTISFAKIFWAIVIFLLGLFLIRFVTRLTESMAERWPKLRMTIKGLVPIIRIFGWTFMIFLLLLTSLSHRFKRLLPSRLQQVSPLVLLRRTF